VEAAKAGAGRGCEAGSNIGESIFGGWGFLEDASKKGLCAAGGMLGGVLSWGGGLIGGAASGLTKGCFLGAEAGAKDGFFGAFKGGMEGYKVGQQVACGMNIGIGLRKKRSAKMSDLCKNNGGNMPGVTGPTHPDHQEAYPADFKPGDMDPVEECGFAPDTLCKPLVTQGYVQAVVVEDLQTEQITSSSAVFGWAYKPAVLAAGSTQVFFDVDVRWKEGGKFVSRKTISSKVDLPANPAATVVASMSLTGLKPATTYMVSVVPNTVSEEGTVSHYTRSRVISFRTK